MAIPSEDQFLEAMRALTKPIPDNLLESFPVVWGVKGGDHAMDSAVEISKWFFSNLHDCKNQPALRWLSNDRMLSLAEKRLTRKWVKLSDHDFAKRLIDSLRPDIEGKREPSEGYLRWDCIQSYVDRYMSTYWLWLFGLLWAFHEYHYEPETVANYLANLKRIQKLKGTVLAGIEAKQQLDVIYGPEDQEFRPLRTRPSEIERNIDRLNRQIEIIKNALPIRKGGGTARERLLIYRLWQVMRLFTYRPKAGVIQYALLAEGIENQIDERNVEKMCADFRSQRRPSMPYRYLINNLRGDKYREAIKEKRLSSYRVETDAE